MPVKGIKIACPCERCGTVKYLCPSRVERGQGRYCSNACKNAPRPLIPHPTDPTITIVPLTKGKVALIDTTDAERVAPYNWSAGWSGFAWYASMGARSKNTRIFLHRFLMDAPEGVEVDHENGDTLDCRRSTNLRLATHLENMQNTKRRSHNRSGFKGVRLRCDGRAWCARITIDGKETSLGSFATAEEAARAYDASALANFGEFAKINSPGEAA